MKKKENIKLTNANYSWKDLYKIYSGRLTESIFSK